MPTLRVWLNGERVADWTQSRGMHELAYAPDWVTSPAGRALSLSLPFVPGNVPHRGAAVANYFDNLLPDSDRIRTRLRSRFDTDSTGAFDLLNAIGRDCAGAVQLLPRDMEPEGWDRIDAEPLSEQQAEQAINAMLAGEIGRAHV